MKHGGVHFQFPAGNLFLSWMVSGHSSTTLTPSELPSNSHSTCRCDPSSGLDHWQKPCSLVTRKDQAFNGCLVKHLFFMQWFGVIQSYTTETTILVWMFRGPGLYQLQQLGWNDHYWNYSYIFYHIHPPPKSSMQQQQPSHIAPTKRFMIQPIKQHQVSHEKKPLTFHYTGCWLLNRGSL